MNAGVIAQCPACRALVVVGTVVVDGSRAEDGTPRAGLPCGACGTVSWLSLATTVGTSRMPTVSALPPPTTAILPPIGDAATATATASSTATSPSPAMAPPPPVVPATTSASTALVAAFDDETVARVRARFTDAQASQTHLAERFEALLTTTWANDGEHKALLKAAAVAGELAFVGSRYRAVLDVVRDEPRARAAQNELLTMAMATMSSQRLAPAEEAPGKARVILGALLFIVVGGGLFWFVRTMITMLSAGGAGGAD